MARFEEYDSRWTGVGLLLTPILLIIAALWLPWATYRNPGLTLSFRTGWIDAVVVACGVLALILACLCLVSNHATVPWLLLTVGCVAVISSLALALSKIAEANDTAMTGHAASQTSWGIGSALGVAASILLVVLSAIQLSSVRARSAHLPPERLDSPHR